MYLPRAIAIDGAGNAFVMNFGSVSELTNSGLALSPSTGFANSYPARFRSDAVAVDGSGNVWFAPEVIPVGGGTSSVAGTSLTEYVGLAAPVATPIAAAAAAGLLGSRP
jgi:hypothetical protein